MTALVVFSHPKPDDRARELLEATTSGLAAAGHVVDLIDLYRDGFNAALSCEEWRVYSTANPVVADDRYAALLGGAEVLAFVFPMWWSGPPSMLKGFFDRVLAPDVAFHLADTGRVSPGLRHVRRLIVVTAAETPGNFPHRSTRQLSRAFARSLRRATGWRTRTTILWAGPGAANKPPEWQRFIEHVRRRMAGLA